MKPTSITLPIDILADLDREAAAQCRSRSSLAAMLIRDGLAALPTRTAGEHGRVDRLG